MSGKGRSKVGEQTDERRRFMPLWATVFGLAPISKVDESDDPNDSLDMEGDGSQCNPMPRWEPYGVMTNPPAKTSAVYFKVSEGGIALPWGTTYQGRPKGTKSGDVALYVDVEQSANAPSVRVFVHGSQSTTPGQVEVIGRAGAKVVIDKDGGVSVTAAPGKDVVFNSGTLQMARKTDPVVSTADFITWATAVKAGIIAALGPDVGLPPTTIGTINGGADRLKG